MKIILVDDEQLNLDSLESIVASVLPAADRVVFSKASRAMEYIRENHIDMALLDIEMRGINGIALAQAVRSRNPQANILFCTGYRDYSLEAWDLDCSGYLLKPITEEKVIHAMENLRYPMEEQKRVQLRCFGNYEAFCDGSPLVFKYSRTKEFLAYLTDRNGAACSMREISAVIFEDDEHTSYLNRLRLDLIDTLTARGVQDILNISRGSIGINRDKVYCDYFDYLDGKLPAPALREYMTQYSFGEAACASLFPEYE